MAYRLIVRNQPLNPDLIMAVQGKKDVNSQVPNSGLSQAGYAQSKPYTEAGDMPDPMQHGMRPGVPPSQASQPMVGQQPGMPPMGSQHVPLGHQRSPGSAMAPRPPMIGPQSQMPIAGPGQTSTIPPMLNSVQQPVVSAPLNGPLLPPTSVPVGQGPQTAQPGSQLPQKTGRVTSIPKPAGIDPLSVLQERENR